MTAFIIAQPPRRFGEELVHIYIVAVRRAKNPQRSPRPGRATLCLQRLRDLRVIRVSEGMVSQEKDY
nr:Hypothetical protein SC2p1_00420 [Methylocystis sp. SC2]